MEQFKKFLGVVLGISALVMLAALVVITLNFWPDLNFTTDPTIIDIFVNVIFYGPPAVLGLAAIYFVSDKNILIFILTTIFVAACLFIYFAQDTFVDFVGSITR